MLSLSLLANAFLFTGFAAAGHGHHGHGKCKGLQWAFYNNTATENAAPGYPSFDPTVYKTVTPDYSSVTYAVGGDYADGLNTHDLSIYGTPEIFDPNQFVLNHKGYIKVKQTGVYTFSVTAVDDILLIWTGTNAYTAWTRDNADCLAVYNVATQTNGTCSFSATYNKGQFVPIRIMYAQNDFPASAFITVTNPSGNVILSSTSGKSKYIIQKGCGKHSTTKAPAFPAWGQE